RTKGNITPHAEFNIYSDPLAARIVFESGIPVTLVPLDATHQVFLTSSIIEERVMPLGAPFSDFVAAALGYDSVAHRFGRGSEVAYLHDPLAVGAVIDPSLVKKERLPIHVETGEGNRFGQTLESQEGNPLEVCLEADSKGFLELFLSRLKNG
ncbi:MAG: nucleoside hydrolase, partial [Deltaproteobacteria bacterium]